MYGGKKGTKKRVFFVIETFVSIIGVKMSEHKNTKSGCFLPQFFS